MKKVDTLMSTRVEYQARQTVSLTFELCKSLIKKNKVEISPELKALSATVQSLEKAVVAFIAAERLCR